MEWVDRRRRESDSGKIRSAVVGGGSARWVGEEANLREASLRAAAHTCIRRSVLSLGAHWLAVAMAILWGDFFFKTCGL